MATRTVRTRSTPSRTHVTRSRSARGTVPLQAAGLVAWNGVVLAWNGVLLTWDAVTDTTPANPTRSSSGRRHTTRSGV